MCQGRGEGGNEKLRCVCFENEYQECRDHWAICYFSKVACQTDCLHLRLLNSIHQPIRSQMHVALTNQRSGLLGSPGLMCECWHWVDMEVWGVRCDDNIDCEHCTSWAPIGQVSASLASDWLISVSLSWQPRMHTWAPHCYGAWCHLQPNRNNSSEPGNISLLCRQFYSESKTIGRSDIIEKDNQLKTQNLLLNQRTGKTAHSKQVPCTA